MNFDQTYITVFGAILFEPVTFLTNTLMMLFCLFAFMNIRKYDNSLSRNWAWFFLLIGLSSEFGAIAHGVQYQLGDGFIRWIIFMVNSVSLIAIYFHFRATHTLYSRYKNSNGNLLSWLVICWIGILLAVTFIQNNFLLIKVHAGIVLGYSFIIHYRTSRQKLRGSGFIAAGIFVSFLSIAVHSFRLSFGEWFNYKDISHVIMIISLVMIYIGVKIKSGEFVTVDRISSVA